MDQDFITEHRGGIWSSLVGFALLILQWMFRREIRRRDEAVADHEARLRIIENDRATKSDISGLYEQFNTMRNRAEERHIELLDRLP